MYKTVFSKYQEDQIKEVKLYVDFIYSSNLPFVVKKKNTSGTMTLKEKG